MSPEKAAEPLLSGADQALTILTMMEDNKALTRSPVGYIDDLITAVRNTLLNHFTIPTDWSTFFLNLGEAVIRLIEMQSEWSPECKLAMALLLEQKGKRYGPKPIRSWGELGVVIRIDSKLQRFMHMVHTGDTGAGTDESLVDTLHDMLGYCVLGHALVMEKNNKH